MDLPVIIFFVIGLSAVAIAIWSLNKKDKKRSERKADEYDRWKDGDFT